MHELNEFEKAINEWSARASACDRKLAKVYRADASQLWQVHALLVKGKLEEAYKAARRLDTIVRDVIPDSVWRMMEGECDG